VPYLSASAVVIHYEEALYKVYGPLPLPLCTAMDTTGPQRKSDQRTPGKIRLEPNVDSRLKYKRNWRKIMAERRQIVTEWPMLHWERQGISHVQVTGE